MLKCLHERCRNLPETVNNFIIGSGIIGLWILGIITVICVVLLCIGISLGCIYVFVGMMPALIVVAADPYAANLMRNYTLPCPINVIYRDVPCSFWTFSLEISTWFIIIVVGGTLIITYIFCIVISIYGCNNYIKNKWAKIVDVIFAPSSGTTQQIPSQQLQTPKV